MHGKSKTKLGIGVIGCGNISMTYLRNAALFGGVELRACADISADMAALRAREYGIRALGVDALLADPDIDLVLNLTIPAAHFDISLSALSAGKHVFTEKPLATSAARRPPPCRRGGEARPAARLGAGHFPRRRRPAGAPADG